MIGKITIGKSFGGCIRYVLEDKLEYSQEMKQRKLKEDGLRHEGRAEVLEYNRCFGNAKELTKQFNEVRLLRPQLSKPVMHISLSLAPQDVTDNKKMYAITKDFAREFGFENNQYLAIFHHDTKHPHLHLVVNRVGFDGKAISDSNSYKRIATICRKLELKHELKQVLNPRQYLSPKDQQIPRHNLRKEKIREDIRDSLKQSTSYTQFEQLMKAKHYEIIKGRGIGFRDEKKMYVKGSDLNFSLKTIEKILAHNYERQQKMEQEQKLKQTLRQILKGEYHPASQKNTVDSLGGYAQKQSSVTTEYGHTNLVSSLSKGVERTLENVMKPEQENEQLPAELSDDEAKRKQKERERQRQRERHDRGMHM